MSYLEYVGIMMDIRIIHKSPTSGCTEANAWAASATLVLFALLAHISGSIFDAFKFKRQEYMIGNNNESIYY
uniref:Uncharacterized protein n=1 Tax=Rhizophagus irregularis (strain DAOM 181602 / DAOM 197198 / MUCL 43194) TaxID=747089 RepID=U9U8P4_RHIID